MKQIFTLLFAVAFLSAQSFAQCTITGFDVCTGASPVTSFTNAQLVSGNDLANGSKYKFNNVTSGIGALDAIVTMATQMQHYYHSMMIMQLMKPVLQVRKLLCFHQRSAQVAI
jgi:hypothetical protein